MYVHVVRCTEVIHVHVVECTEVMYVDVAECTVNSLSKLPWYVWTSHASLVGVLYQYVITCSACTELMHGHVVECIYTCI